MVRRSAALDEYPGAWSFPSAFIESDVSALRICDVLATKVSAWLGLELADLELLRVHDGLRPAWRLRMYLYGVETTGTPSIRIPKYDGYRWVDGSVVFLQKGAAEGDCTKAYVDYLKDCQRRSTDSSHPGGP